MKFLQFIGFILLPTILFSCKKSDKKEEDLKETNVVVYEPVVETSLIQTNFGRWWTYYSDNISLSSNFIGLNEQLDTIPKREFLEKLLTAQYIPLKVKSSNRNQTYKLLKLDAKANQDIAKTIRNESLTFFKYFEMEGLPFPEFIFEDIDGNIYTNENTKGKILFIKTWFINCAACVAEFPILNEYVEKYTREQDAIFLSLATDREIKLNAFLKTKVFNYEVVANQKTFISKTLNLQIFPTHLVVDENGIIVKVVNKASEMISYLSNDYQNEIVQSNPPPPM